mgnify:CR=1 FL=1
MHEQFSAIDLVEGKRAVLMDWFKVKDIAAYAALSQKEKTALHEKFAEAFEVYLARGEYPARRLAGPMARFRLWMGEVYRGIKMKGEGTLDPGITAVFDRLLATDDEIENVKTAAGLKALPREALGMTPEEYVVHLEQLAKATSHAQLAGALEVMGDHHVGEVGIVVANFTRVNALMTLALKWARRRALPRWRAKRAASAATL